MKPLETEAPVSYPAILTTEGTYTLISFPDCPGCRTFVEPGEDVLAIAQDALSGWLEAAVEDREDSPHPTPQSQLSQTERVLAVPVPLDLARQLEAKWGTRVGSVAPAQHSPRKHIRPRGGPPKGSETPLTASGQETSWARPISLLWRAARLRCPNCGGGPLFKNWLQMQVPLPDLSNAPGAGRGGLSGRGLYVQHCGGGAVLRSNLRGHSHIPMACAPMGTTSVWGYGNDGGCAGAFLPLLQGSLPGLRSDLPTACSRGFRVDRSDRTHLIVRDMGPSYDGQARCL